MNKWALVNCKAYFCLNLSKYDKELGLEVFKLNSAVLLVVCIHYLSIYIYLYFFQDLVAFITFLAPVITVASRMLQYTHGSLNVPTLQNNGNLFVHRLAQASPERKTDMILSSYTSASSYSSNTYWKSPNTMESSAVRPNGICLPPEMRVTSSFSHRPRSSIKSREVKGILKNKDTAEHDTTNTTPRSACDQTSTGNTRTKSSSNSKRVQFDGLPKQQEKSSKHAPDTDASEVLQTGNHSRPNSSSAAKHSTYNGKRVPYAGIYMFRREHSARSINRKHFLHTNTDNGRSHITAFIKKLQLVESAKLKRAEENIRQMEKLDKETEKNTEKLCRPRIKSAMFKSVETGRSYVEGSYPKTDSERLKSALSDVVRKTEKDNKIEATAQNIPKPKLDSKRDEYELSKDLLPSNSFLLSQMNTDRTDKLRRQRAFSAYTRHNSVAPPYLKVWKPNESNCFKDDNDRRVHLLASSRKHVNNYCDYGKTNQILGWLHDVKIAQSDTIDQRSVSPTFLKEEIHTESDSDLTND